MGAGELLQKGWWSQRRETWGQGDGCGEPWGDWEESGRRWGDSSCLGNARVGSDSGHPRAGVQVAADHQSSNQSRECESRRVFLATLLGSH